VSYIQVKKPNYNIPYVGGFCEGYVEGTVGEATIPTPKEPVTFGVFKSASGAWANLKGKHPGEQPPKGVSVALYFTLGSTPAGHTAIWLGDGRVASSSQGGYHTSPAIHPSLQNLIDVYAAYNQGCTYLGWSEYIGNVQVVKKGEDVEKVTLNTARILAYSILGRDGIQGRKNALAGETDADLNKYHVGQTLNTAYIDTLYNSAEAKGFRAALAKAGTPASSVVLAPGNYQVK
jgi:hypothetical protein